MNTPQQTNHKSEIANLAANLKAKSVLYADEKAELQNLLAQIQRLLPPASPSFGSRPPRGGLDG